MRAGTEYIPAPAPGKPRPAEWSKDAMSLPIPGLRPIAVFWGGLLVAGSAGAIALQSMGAPSRAPAHPAATLAAAPLSGLVNEAADPLAGPPVIAAANPAPSPTADAALPVPPMPVAPPPPMLAETTKLPPLRAHHAHRSVARRETHAPARLARRTTTTTTVVAEVPSYSAGSVQYRSYPDGWRPYYAEAYPPPPPYYVAPYRGYYAAY